MRRFIAFLVCLAFLCAPAADAKIKYLGTPPAGGGGGGCSSCAFVQTIAAGVVFSGTTVGQTMTGVGTGHAILGVALLDPNTLTVTGVTATGGTCVTGNNSGTAYAFRGTPFVCYGVSSGSVVITATASGSITVEGIIATQEWSGLTTGSSPLDGSAASYTADGTASTNLPCSSGFTTTANSDLIWNFMYQPQNAAPTVGAGFTSVNITTTGTAYFTEQQIQSTAGAITPNYTSATGSNDNVNMCMGLK